MVKNPYIQLWTNSLKNKLSEIYEYRNMIRAQVEKNLFGQYRNSILGFGWNFVIPIIYIILNYILYTQFYSNNIDNFILFLSSGIFLYTMLINSIVHGVTIFTNNNNLIKKIYFPKEILAISDIISSMIITIIGYIAVLALSIITGYNLCWYILPITLLMLIFAFIFCIGCELLLGSIAVYIRDVQFFLGSLSIVFFVCTPIRTMFSDSNGIISIIFTINPLSYFIEPLHQVFYYHVWPSTWMLIISGIISIIVLIIGYCTFSKLKNGFVERL